MTGTIQVFVKDAEGQPFPAAKVVLKDLTSSVVRFLRTNEDGLASFTELARGDYRVEVSAPGAHWQAFETWQTEGDCA